MASVNFSGKIQKSCPVTKLFIRRALPALCLAIKDVKKWMSFGAHPINTARLRAIPNPPAINTWSHNSPSSVLSSTAKRRGDKTSSRWNLWHLAFTIWVGVRVEGGGYRCPNIISAPDKQWEVKVPQQKIADNFKISISNSFSPILEHAAVAERTGSPPKPATLVRGKHEVPKALDPRGHPGLPSTLM